MKNQTPETILDLAQSLYNPSGLWRDPTTELINQLTLSEDNANSAAAYHGLIHYGVGSQRKDIASSSTLSLLKEGYFKSQKVSSGRLALDLMLHVSNVSYKTFEYLWSEGIKPADERINPELPAGYEQLCLLTALSVASDSQTATSHEKFMAGKIYKHYGRKLIKANNSIVEEEAGNQVIVITTQYMNAIAKNDAKIVAALAVILKMGHSDPFLNDLYRSMHNDLDEKFPIAVNKASSDFMFALAEEDPLNKDIMKQATISAYRYALALETQKQDSSPAIVTLFKLNDMDGSTPSKTVLTTFHDVDLWATLRKQNVLRQQFCNPNEKPYADMCMLQFGALLTKPPVLREYLMNSDVGQAINMTILSSFGLNEEEIVALSPSEKTAHVLHVMCAVGQAKGILPNAIP